jgi:hypothetical protein
MGCLAHAGPVELRNCDHRLHGASAQHLDFLCRVVLPREATGDSLSMIEECARLGSVTPRGELPIPRTGPAEKVGELRVLHLVLGSTATSSPPFGPSWGLKVHNSSLGHANEPYLHG